MKHARVLAGGSLSLVVALGLHCSDPNAPVAASQVLVTPLFVSLVIGSTQQLAAAAVDADGDTIPDANLTYSSNDPTVARVSTSGLVTAVSSGTAVITVASGPASANIPVAVVDPATVVVTPPAAFLQQDQTVQLTATAYDGQGQPLPSAPFTFSSSDMAVATVSATGLVTAVGVGTVGIVARSGSTRDTSRVTAVVARTMLGGEPYGAAVSAGPRRDDECLDRHHSRQATRSFRSRHRETACSTFRPTRTRST